MFDDYNDSISSYDELERDWDERYEPEQDEPYEPEQDDYYPLCDSWYEDQYDLGDY